MIRTSSSVLALCAALVLVSAAERAGADASAADIATAKALVVEGRSLRDKGNHATARDRFKAAFALVQTPIIGIDLAREHVALQELIEAREVAITVTKLPENPKESAEGRAARVEAAKLANELAPRIGTIVITVDALPADGVVLLDGATLPTETLGAPRRINPGKHEITVRVGAKKTVRAVTIAEGASESVSIDGKEIATPGSGSSAAGSSTGAARDSGTSAPLWPWFAIGAGGVGVLIAGGYAVSAVNYDSKVDACNDTCSKTEIDDHKASRNRAWTISAVAGVVGAAGIVIGVYGRSTQKSSSASSAGATSLRVGPGSIDWVVTF